MLPPLLSPSSPFEMSTRPHTPLHSANGSAVRTGRQSQAPRSHPYAPPPSGTHRSSATPPAAGTASLWHDTEHAPSSLDPPYMGSHSDHFRAAGPTPAADPFNMNTTNLFTIPRGHSCNPSGNYPPRSLTPSSGDAMDMLYPLPGQMPPQAFAAPQNHRPQHPSGATSSARTGLADLELLFTKFNINSQLRPTVYSYAQMPPDDKLNALFMLLLRVESKVEKHDKAVNDINRHMNKIKKLCALAWVPSPAQEKLCHALTRHYLVKPIGSYTSIPKLVKSYIKDHAKEMRLGLWYEDDTVKATLTKLLHELASQMKSLFRKAIFTSCKKSVPLKSFAKNMFENYHAPKVPSDIPRISLATFAMLHEIALPLSRQKNQKGSDTGFWKAVEAELDRLWREFGKNRNDQKWLEWIKMMINADEKQFNPSGRSRSQRMTCHRGQRRDSSLDPDSAESEPGEPIEDNNHGEHIDNDFGINDVNADTILGQSDINNDEDMLPPPPTSRSNANEMDDDIHISQIASGNMAATL
ncbi:hypothetical protein C8Q80DRAFT_1274813 [Daedaleopsis nitida]|nr:hypothetical protein C8Q80DRAFT_1274813 [Daedaleopsis nitida]